MTLRRPLAAALSIAGLVSLQAQAPEPQVPPPPACQVSADPEFALTPQRPMRVGGGAMYVAARERRYLEGLRGPAGQTVSFTRNGSTRSPDGKGILDAWSVTYDGLAAPIVVYLDAYHYEEPKAPAGFTCVPFTLGPPPVDGFMASDQIVAAAVEYARTAAGIAPIPLGADGGATHGVAFDRFRMLALAARAAAAAGKPIDPEAIPAGFGNVGLTIVAYPLTCGDRTVVPVAIEIVPRQGQAPPSQRPLLTRDEITSLLGQQVAVPDGAIAHVSPLATLRPGDAVRIGYSTEVCDNVATIAMLRTAHAGARPLSLPDPQVPAGIAGPIAPVLLQVIIDPDGRFRQPRHIGGPDALVDAAVAAIRGWRATPATINGAPVSSETLLLVPFKAAK